MSRLALAAVVCLCALLFSASARADSPPPWNEVDPEPATCTVAELRVLAIPLGVPVFDGWYALNELHAAIRRACAKVPARWRWVNRDFTRATQLVDRLYPREQHGSWARSCASSEGGHGPWVPNRLGSGAGGWLQFMSGTFWGVIDSAIARARSHGVRVPGLARSWYSPLGQALAGSEMLFRDRRGEWSGSSC